MNLELLISKYIDGELTAREDEQLRHLLKEDPAAREEFDNYLELHLAMVEDADTIVVPSAVKRATEDRVMMAILNNTPKIIPIKRSYNQYYKAAAVAVFLLFTFIFQINDKFHNFTVISDNIEQSNVNKNNDINLQAEVQSLRDKTIPNKKVNRTNPIQTNHSNLNNGDSEGQEVAVISNKLLDDQIVSTNNSQTIETIAFENSSNEEPSKVSSSDNFNKDRKINITSNSLELAAPKDIMPQELYNFGNSEINLATSISYDFLRGGINTYDNTTIKNYSQSISYSINDKSRIGLEFGMTEFYYPNTHYIRINSSVNNNSKVEILDPTLGDNYILVPIQIKESEKNYWGTIFYEQNLLNFGAFDIDGRVGLGSTSDGFLGIGRIITKYNVISGLYISAGAEGRTFNYNLPLKNSRGVINNLSFVWGIYFQF